MIRFTTRIFKVAGGKWQVESGRLAVVTCNLLLATWLLASCAAGGGNQLAPYSPDEDGVARPFGVLEPGEADGVLLPTTAPEDVEDDPRLVLDVTFFDEFSGAQLAGDVEVFKRAGSVEAGAIARIDAVACEGQLRCVIAVRPTGPNNAPWVIEIRAAGYVTQELELRARALSSQAIDMPVLMRPVGLDG